MANSSAICAPTGNNGKEEISACRIPWIRVYIYIYIYIRGSLFYFSRKRDMNNDPGKNEGIAVEFLGTGEGEWWRGVVFGNFHLG